MDLSERTLHVRPLSATRMTCPNCGAPIVAQDPIADVTICDTCLASVVASTGLRATAAETTVLDAADISALRRRRASYRAAQVPA